MKDSFSLTEQQYRSIISAIYWLLGTVCLICFDQRGLWPDEGFRLLLMNGARSWGAQQAAADFAPYRDVLIALGPHQYQPAFFLLWNSLFAIIGHVSITAIRLGNLLFLFAALTGVLRLCREWQPLTRVYVAVAFAFNGYLLMHTMQIREYPLYLALATWSTVAYFVLYNAVETDRRRIAGWWLLYVSCGILGYYTHSYFIFLLFTQAAFVLWKQENRRVFAVTIYSAQAAILAAALPWISYLTINFPGRSDPGKYSAGLPQTVSYLLETLVIGFRLVFTYNDSLTKELATPAAIARFLDFNALILYALILTSVVYLIRRKRKADPLVAYAVLTILVFLGFQAGWFFLKDQLSTWPRYFIGHYLALTILAGFGFKLIHESALVNRPALMTGLTTGAISVAALAGGFQTQKYTKFPYVDTPVNSTCGWNEVAINLSSRVQAGDTLVVYHPMHTWTMSERFQTPVKESHFWRAQTGDFPKGPSVWILDTSTDPALQLRAETAIVSAGYQHTGTEKLGCLASLRRYDSAVALARRKADLVAPVGVVSPLQSTSIAPPPGPSALVIEAEKLRAGNAVPDSRMYGAGIGVLTTTVRPVWAEYEVAIPKAGRYELRTRYASAEARPVSLFLNQVQATGAFCKNPTGGYTPEHQKWYSEGVFELQNGKVRLKLESEGPFPHIDKLALILQ